MGLKNTKETYGIVAKFFHWFTALIILGLILAGLYMAPLPYSPFKLEIYALHKSFGLLVLWLVGLRLIWRFISVKPQEHPNHQTWERLLAKLAHFLLYVAMIGMPLSGWLMSSAGEYPVPFFGFQMPDLVGKNRELAGLMGQVHTILSYVLVGTIGLHALGALKHHFIDKDSTLKRMMAQPMQKIGPYLLIIILGLFGFGVVTLFLGGKQQTEEISTEVISSVQEDISVAENEKNAWTIVDEQSRLIFKASVYGKEFSGEFKNFDGEIIFDLDNLKNSHVDISIDMASVDSEDEERDVSMKDAEWFDVQNHREAVFKANDFEEISSDRYLARGILTIKGNAVPIEFPFDLTIHESPQNGREALVKGQVTLNRLDFGLGKGRWESADSVAFDVIVDVALTARSKN